MATEPIEQLRQIEESIRKGDTTAIEVRWASGQYLLTLKEGKQLPKGTLVEYAEALGVHRSELSARMKFAEKFPTESEVSTAIETFGSWSNIRQNALTDKSKAVKHETRPKAVTSASVKKLLDLFDTLAPETVDAASLEKLYQAMADLEQRVKAVKALPEAA